MLQPIHVFYDEAMTGTYSKPEPARSKILEVPPIETNATGWAEFRPILTENTVTYTLNVTDTIIITIS